MCAWNMFDVMTLLWYNQSSTEPAYLASLLHRLHAVSCLSPGLNLINFCKQVTVHAPFCSIVCPLQALLHWKLGQCRLKCCLRKEIKKHLHTNTNNAHREWGDFRSKKWICFKEPVNRSPLVTVSFNVNTSLVFIQFASIVLQCTWCPVAVTAS